MFLSIGLSLTVSTGAACVIPAIKAAQTNPVEALRYE
jgi:ABC-type lipoprotein release transport system permease subunit